MGRPIVRLAVVTIAAMVAAPLVLRSAAPAPRVQSTSQTPPQTPQTPPNPQTPQAPPVFKAGSNLVMVDAYPLRDGRIVEGLTPDDFQVFEDGKPQKVEGFEFLRVEPSPDAVHHDPNTVGESLKLAADPHNRVFVVYLDTHFVRVDGSHDIRRPLVDMLGRILAPNDLFGVLSPAMRASDIALGRIELTVDQELSNQWPWGTRDSLKVIPEGQLKSACYTQSGGPAGSQLFDSTPIRDVPPEALQRSYEDLTLTRLDELVAFLGRVREARSEAIVVTDGWVLYGPNEGLASQVSAASGSGDVPGMYLGPGGKLTQSGQGGLSPSACTGELIRLARLDNRQRLHDLIAKANRNNVTFFVVNPSGLAVWDTSPASQPYGGGPLQDNLDALSSRLDSVQTLAANTDGLAIINTNDLTAGLKRIIDDVSAYYLLGYYSTNTKLDGKYRRIEVKMRPPKIQVSARRGYTAGTEGDHNSAPAKAPTASAVGDALTRLDRAKPEAELVAAGAVQGGDLAIVAEIASRPIESGQWSDGADAQVVVVDAAGQELPPVHARIDAGARGVLLHVPVGDTAPGPWTARVKVTGPAGSIDDRIDVARETGALVGAALISRGSPSARSVLRPVADAQFSRTERAHIEWPIVTPLDAREARLLGRNGQPLAVAVTLTERDNAGRPTLAADVNLAPLAPGDYVIELTVGAGAQTQHQDLAIRIVH